MKWILSDPVLFHLWGSKWQLSKVFFFSGLLLMLISAVLFVVLVRYTKTKWRRLDATAASDVAFNAGKPFMRNIEGVGKSAGASIEITFGIDDLRQAARRGDWAFFILCPTMFCLWCLGLWLVFSTFLMAMPLGFWVLVTVLTLGMMGACIYVSWAALYTNVDLGTARSVPGTRDR